MSDWSSNVCSSGLVGQLQRRLAEEQVAALRLDAQDRALDRTDRLRADQPVLRRDLLARLGGLAEKRAQVVQAQQQPAVVVGHREHDFKQIGRALWRGRVCQYR